MTDPRVQSAQDDVARYAEDAKRNLTGDSGGGVFGGIIGVIRDMVRVLTRSRRVPVRARWR